MTGTIRLVCWACDRPFTMERRRGQYPTRCAECRAERPAVERLAALCRRVLGLEADVVRDERFGWIVRVSTPWHEHPAPIRDLTDVQYLRAELAAYKAVDPAVDEPVEDVAA